MAKDAPPKPRLCHLRKWQDFAGYGFNLHAEKGKAGHFIGRVDAGSPALAGGLREGDRVVEVNGTNVGNENHQQVVARIQSVANETRILVADSETDEFYRKNRIVLRWDLPEVEIIEVPQTNPFTKSAPRYKGKFCDLKAWPNFIGYGFNLHGEKGNPSHIIGKVDPKSPAEATGMKEGDRIVEVNSINVLGEPHMDAVRRIKSDPRRVTLLLVDEDTEVFLREHGSTAPSKLLDVGRFICPDSSPYVSAASVQRAESGTRDNSAAAAAGDRVTAQNNSSSEKKSTAVNSHSSPNPVSSETRYRLCHMKRPDGDSRNFGFTMHANKGMPGHFITEIDPGSIAERSGLLPGDRVIEVNGANVEMTSHARVVEMIKAVPNETYLLVIDDSRDHDCPMSSSRDSRQTATAEPTKGKFIIQKHQEDAEDSISNDYRQVTDEIIAVAEREEKTDLSNAARKSDDEPRASKTDYSLKNPEVFGSNGEKSKLDESKKSSVVISGIEFAPSAEEARRRMQKKSRVKEENLSIRDKFRLFEKL